MNFIRAYFKTLDFFAPKIAAKKVYSFMSNPQVRKLRAFEVDVLKQASQETVNFKNFALKTYIWGQGEKIIMLVHGWEGQAGNFGALVKLLVAKGFKVVAFDAPAHGNSSKGKTNMFEFSEFVSSMLAKYQPSQIISHSFGSVTAAAALKNNTHLPIEQWVMVTTPSRFIDRIKDVSKYIGVTDKTTKSLIRLVEKDLRQDINSLNMPDYCKELKNVSKALIVHSKDDKVLPIAASRTVHQHFPQSEMIELDKLGHYKILWSEELREIIDKYVN